MATGTFGTRRPADVSINDVEIFYTYSVNRETTNTDVFSLDATEILTELKDPADTDNPLGGLYNLRLPSTVFNAAGIYTVYVRPKQIDATIVDCSTLLSNTSIKGIVLDTNETSLQEISDRLNTNGLVGWRIEYYNSDLSKRRNFFRIITTSNLVEPISVNNNGNSSVRYRFNDSGNLLFLTLTPSSSFSSVKSNQTPFIGSPGDLIILTPTTFNPVMIEVELSNYTNERIGTFLESQQIRDINNGIVTYYNDQGEIIAQFDLYSKLENGEPEYEVKQKRTTIDESQNFGDITTTD